MPKAMTHIDLFSGIGGFSLGFQRAGYNTVAHSELDPYACKVYHRHFPGSHCLGDITKIDWRDYEGKIDVITGGIPCQPHSVAGKRKGSGDERDLWHEYLRAIRGIRPRFAVIENVPGLLTSNGGGCTTESCLTFPKSGLMQSGKLFLLGTLGLPIFEKDSGSSLSTPTASDASSGAVIGKNDKFRTLPSGRLRKINQNGKDGSIGLAREIMTLATPCARDFRSHKRRKENHDYMRLNEDIGNLPTPTGTDTHSREPNSKQIGMDNFMKLLPTPRAGNPGSRPNRKGGRILNEVIGTLPTPGATSQGPDKNSVEGNYRKSQTTGTTFGMTLQTKIAILPTPIESDYKGERMRTEAKGRNPMTNSLVDAIGHSGRKDGMKWRYEPAMGEFMQGYPMGWTSLDCPITPNETSPTEPKESDVSEIV